MAGAIVDRVEEEEAMEHLLSKALWCSIKPKSGEWSVLERQELVVDCSGGISSVWFEDEDVEEEVAIDE